MGERSFICRSSLGGWIISPCPYYFFSFWLFVVLCWCSDSWGHSLSPKTFFFFKMVYVWGIASHLKFTFHCHFYINVTFCRLTSLFKLIFFIYFCLGISEEDTLLVKYLSCTICIFLRNTGKYDICSGQNSHIVWCDIFRSSCSFNQHGEWNSTVVLTFLFYISHLTDNYTKMQMILSTEYSWTFLSFSISIFILCICYH